MYNHIWSHQRAHSPPHPLPAQIGRRTGEPCAQSPYVFLMVLALLLFLVAIFPIPVFVMVITMKNFRVSFKFMRYFLHVCLTTERPAVYLHGVGLHTGRSIPARVEAIYGSGRAVALAALLHQLSIAENEAVFRRPIQRLCSCPSLVLGMGPTTQAELCAHSSVGAVPLCASETGEPTCTNEL